MKKFVICYVLIILLASVGISTQAVAANQDSKYFMHHCIIFHIQVMLLWYVCMFVISSN